MFEKSLYDLIRGLRNHKGNEREYIQNSLRECRTEIKGADMDLKATALLKLVYMEMFGHDMSWASFHVLEVMSSQKYLQKRVGYLAAVQSFRPDTEVLMLATNLLKKDVNSAQVPTLSLPLISLPHVNTTSLALSLSSDILTRLTHSNPLVRKKTVVTLYRLALVHPETLKVAWPKIKGILMNEEEDPSVTAAVVNVVCELGWRRPQDFLPLAPRLFELLVDGGNNWMAIKIIKLFATLTPLEPRLVKKLLPPLTNLIRTTPAMSLLYECINGIIQGGIFKSGDGGEEGDEIARLCAGKLRDMILVEDDPNLRYVALLAFNQIVLTHPMLVSAHQDAILGCIDDLDISIRLQALDLGSRMVNAENLMTVVTRLMRQLKKAPLASAPEDDRQSHRQSIEPAADSDSEDPEETLRPTPEKNEDIMTLPNDYRISIIQRILEVCSKDMYSNIVDFEWYIETLSQLTKFVPLSDISSQANDSAGNGTARDNVAAAIGLEFQNIAVRVNAVRPEVVAACTTIISTSGSDTGFPNISLGGKSILQHAAWVVGEYATCIPAPTTTMSDLIHNRVRGLPTQCICSYLLSIPKVLIAMTSHDHLSWTPERKSMVSLLLARIIHFLEPLASHSDLEVQSRAFELLELLRLTAQAVSDHANDELQGPLLLTTVLPSLYTGEELKPVAAEAQSKIPVPEDLDLDTPINPNLATILQDTGDDIESGGANNNDFAEIDRLYNERPTKKAIQGSVTGPAINLLRPSDEPSPVVSYQQPDELAINSEVAARKRIERRAKNKDDPFYIGGEDDKDSGTSTPFHDILRSSNGDQVDVDSIPIMDLDLGNIDNRLDPSAKASSSSAKPKKRKTKRAYQIAQDETLDLPTSSTPPPSTTTTNHTTQVPFSSSSSSKTPLSTSPSTIPLPPSSSSLPKKQTPSGSTFLSVDSSNLLRLSLSDTNPPESNSNHHHAHNNNNSSSSIHDVYRTEEEEAEMAAALKEVERLRLEMQRANDRVEVGEGVDPEGVLVRKKKRKKKKKKEKKEEGEEG